MMPRFLNAIFVITLFLSLSCDPGISRQSSKPRKSKRDESNKVMNRIVQRGVLRAATDYGSVSYLIYRGETIGYQYELLKELTKYLGVDLEMVIEKSLDRSVEMLKNEEIDLIAMGLTVTNERKKALLFTDPIMTSEQVLV